MIILKEDTPLFFDSSVFGSVPNPFDTAKIQNLAAAITRLRHRNVSVV